MKTDLRWNVDVLGILGWNCTEVSRRCGKMYVLVWMGDIADLKLVMYTNKETALTFMTGQKCLVTHVT